MADIFGAAGFLVIHADEVGRDVLKEGSEATRRVADAWPDVVVDGVVDRSALAEIVFSKEEDLARLESMTHPAIVREIERRVSRASGDVVVEVPLARVVPAGEWRRVAVVAEEQTRIARAVARGGDPDDVRRRIASQMSEAEWMDWADVVIDNDGSWSETEMVVRALIDEARQ